MARIHHYINLFSLDELFKITGFLAAPVQLAKKPKEKVKMSRIRYQLTWTKKDGTPAKGTIKCIKPEGLEKLAASLNQAEPNRNYKVVPVYVLENEIRLKAAK